MIVDKLHVHAELAAAVELLAQIGAEQAAVLGRETRVAYRAGIPEETANAGEPAIADVAAIAQVEPLGAKVRGRQANGAFGRFGVFESQEVDQRARAIDGQNARRAAAHRLEPLDHELLLEDGVGERREIKHRQAVFSNLDELLATAWQAAHREIV